VANFTRHREEFEEVLHRIGPAVYVAFFTLTGLSLKLDTLLTVLPFAALLFLVRMGAIAVGSNVGARLAGRDGFLRDRSWMALITQAGIALGLAREAGVQFPELGAAFSTLIISVVVLNEIFGPMILRRVLERSGEIEDGGAPTDVAVYGVDHNALRLADTLAEAGMHPVLVDDDLVHVTRARDTGASATLLTGRRPDDLAALDPRPAVLVAMSGDDAANLEVCRAATEVGINQTVARVADPSLLEDFHELGTLVIDPTAAMVSLLEQAVRTPDTTRLVLHADDERDVTEVTIGRGNVAGRQLRELRLPDDVLVMGVRRRGHVLVPDGFTSLRRGDVMTLVGEPGALRAARAVLAEQDDMAPTRTADAPPTPLSSGTDG
jgi:Trk K+ transport system NAD-binding subunit